MTWRNTEEKEGRREGKQMGENFLRFSIPQGRPRITVNECLLATSVGISNRLYSGFFILLW